MMVMIQQMVFLNKVFYIMFSRHKNQKVKPIVFDNFVKISCSLITSYDI
jgi:hypothetical protein